MQGRDGGSAPEKWKGRTVLLRFVDEAMDAVQGKLEEVDELGLVLSYPKGYRGVKHDQWVPDGANMGLRAPGHEEFYGWPNIASIRPVDDWDRIEDQRPA